ncbi:hypothetical protein TPHA_0E03170 [Tetrapisispora phaffii CBS 4417]|uniref:Alcohol acetyltransferase n=1 Tax=Tetrapisispora phaffii (strain ATCC 24235 / CBS 4417 / NBRC 1672 / NRRL Y-8282 / UCD 70-5) TaxID=1071381 RepID=G8BU29_TETPH|nr:hypothetical protein TPHA_0E03170 [Tetrapisispora phaffii CBS 4417]CCE63407.1 hypothetical protein TPHA_0E03170 [Tetrapisispora phaffii CBS 4417]
MSLEALSFDEYKPYITEELIERGHARRMGHLQDYFAIIQRQKLYNNFNIYCELNEKVNKVQLSHAFREMFLQYPALIEYIVPKFYPKHEAYYRSEEYLSKPCPIHDYIRVLNEVNINDIIMNEQDEYKSITTKISDIFVKNDYKFSNEISEMVSTIKIAICDPKKPNWRIICLPSKTSSTEWKDFILVSNHFDSDGTSAVNFFEDLTNILSKQANVENDTIVIGNDINIINYSKDYKLISKLPIPITERISYTPTLSSIPKFIVGNICKTKLQYTSDGGDTPAEFVSEDPLTYDYLINFSSEEVAKMKKTIKNCLYNSVTLTPFIQACFFVAMYKYNKILNLNNWWQWGVDCALATNARRLLPDDPETRDLYRYGSNVGGTHYFNLISQFNINEFEYDKFFKLVDYYHKNYQNSYRNGDELVGFGVLFSDLIINNTNMDKTIKDDYTNHKRGGLLFSNVGYRNEDLTKKVHVNNIIFSQSPGCMKFTFGLNLISTDKCGMNILMNGVRGSVKSRENFEDFCRFFRKTVENFAKL